MTKMKHIFTSVEELAAFVAKAEKCDYDIDVRYNHFIIDGKSLIGVMNIGIGKQVEIICHDTYDGTGGTEGSAEKNKFLAI